MTEAEFKLLVDQQADALKSDWFLFTNPINDHAVDKIFDELNRVVIKRENAHLILCTNGGSPDAAFQIARMFKRAYKTFTVLVFGYCKSAGTLLAVGADILVMSPAGHLGPLDIQLADKDEFAGQTAALDVQQALRTLSETTIQNFIDFFIKLGPGQSLSTKNAGELAKGLALGVISPIAAHVDPLLIGRVDRSMRIAQAYIDQLSPGFQNKEKLVGGYPSHEFVIDYQEAQQFFGSRLRCPSPEESSIEAQLRLWRRVPRQSDFVGLLSTPLPLPPPPPGAMQPAPSLPTPSLVPPPAKPPVKKNKNKGKSKKTQGGPHA